MKKTFLLLLAATLLATTSCQRETPKFQYRTQSEKLIARMDSLRTHGLLYGHQDDTFYGITWQWDADRSDTRELVADYPAVMGFDMGGLERSEKNNLDGVPFERIEREIIAHYKRGGIVTLSWHPRNPATNGSAWDVSDTTVVASILPGGKNHERFVTWMRKLTNFMKKLKPVRGRSVPIILRPFHEANGGWFWWGTKCCTDEQYKRLWAMFQDFVNAELPNNIVWSYSPNLQGNWTEEEFMRRYPGNDRVQLIGCDAYQWEDEKSFITQLDADLQFLDSFAHDNHKLLALTECGIRNSPTPDWWSRVLLPVLSPYSICYCLAWRNWHVEHFGASVDASTADDFRELKAKRKLLFLKDIAPQIYDASGRNSAEIIWL